VDSKEGEKGLNSGFDLHFQPMQQINSNSPKRIQQKRPDWLDDKFTARFRESAKEDPTLMRIIHEAATILKVWCKGSGLQFCKPDPLHRNEFGSILEQIYSIPAEHRVNFA
jgi:hypothetical protein